MIDATFLGALLAMVVCTWLCVYPFIWIDRRPKLQRVIHRVGAGLGGMLALAYVLKHATGAPLDALGISAVICCAVISVWAYIRVLRTVRPHAGGRPLDGDREDAQER